MLFDTPLMGANYRPMESQVVVHDLKDDEELTLVREPENKYDGNAIQVHKGEHFIGFIAKAHAAKIAPRMDEGYKSSCMVKHAGGLRPMLYVELHYDKESTDDVEDRPSAD